MIARGTALVAGSGLNLPGRAGCRACRKPQARGFSCFLSGRAAQDVGVAAGSVRIGAAVPAEFEAGDLIAMHFVGAVGEAQGAGRGVGIGQAEIVADAARRRDAWIAQSITWQAMFGATTLIIAISPRAALLPTVSIM